MQVKHVNLNLEGFCMFGFCFGLKMVSAGGSNFDKCLQAQLDEIDVLRSIFGEDWKTENEPDRSYSMEIKEGDHSVTLFVTLSASYPYDSPPTFTISAPGMKRECKQYLNNLLEEVYLQNIGQVVLFQWVDKIKEYLASLILNSENLVEDATETLQSEHKAHEIENRIPEIVHGEIIVDRKSTFQGHVAFVLSLNEVRNALNEIKKNRKIANATHNICAYRISCSGDTVIQDCDDDGETNAGSRLLHLLEILNVINTLVVVSRWYGGIHLGSARFSHINNAARQALVHAGVISINKKKS